MKNLHYILAKKPEWTRPPGKLMQRWEDNTKMDLKERGIHLAQDRVQWQVPVNIVMNIQVTKKAGNFLISQATISFSRRSLLHAVRQ